MWLDLILCASLASVLLGYFLAALLRPDRF